MNVSYGLEPKDLTGATNTEITAYLWPGFLGEYDHSSLEFTAWALVESGLWIPRPEILAPPISCIASETVSVIKIGSEWLKNGGIWRQLSPCQMTL